MRLHWRTCSLLAGGLLAFACGDPDLKTDLDSEGPPEVNTVTVTHEGPPLLANGGPFAETPAFCRSDGGRLHREICPEEARVGDIAVNDVRPVAFHVRLVFSELLDPSVEVLEDRNMDGIVEGHIDSTSPVSLNCDGNDVEFDGYYDPSGNDVTAPPGPSLVVSPLDPFPTATATSCELNVADSVTDKDGNPVPAEFQGPYTFTIAPLHFVAADPADGTEGVEPAMAVLALVFNAPIDMATVDASDVSLSDGDGEVAVNLALDPSGTVLLVLPAAGNLEGETTYTLTLPSTAELNDVRGGALVNPEDVSATFTTAPFMGPDAGAGDAGVDAS